jgi:tRNA threonylcarbamoyladenosine biosynthesis protein TsaB
MDGAAVFPTPVCLGFAACFSTEPLPVLLSLDSSSLTLSMALFHDDLRVVEVVQQAPPLQQSVVLPAALFDLLERHQVPFRALTQLVIGLGPGSFTGLRIGLSTLKALAYAHGIALVGESSLRALATEAFGRPGMSDLTVLALATVKRGEVYCQSFRLVDNVCVPIDEVKSITVLGLAQQVSGDDRLRLCGPALDDCEETLLSLGVLKPHVLPHARLPNAAFLVRPGFEPIAYDRKAVFALEPTYVRGSGAEENAKFPPLPGLVSAARLKTDSD